MNTMFLVRQSAMSDAKEKAKEEIESYRATMETEFQEKQKSVVLQGIL